MGSVPGRLWCSWGCERICEQQLHVTGKVAWRKHAWLQASLVLFAAGSPLLVLAFVAF
jgi:hypothetical protein